MRPPIHKLTMQALAEKWGTTAQTISKYSRRGCDFDASDLEVGRWLLSKPTIKKSRAMMEAIYAIPGINDPYSPAPAKTRDEADAIAVGRLMMRWHELDEKVSQLTQEDTEAALECLKELHELERQEATLKADIRALKC